MASNDLGGQKTFVSNLFMSRDFKNGMTLAYWMKIEVSRDPKSFDSDLSKFSEKI